jgi:hypothetical protein
MCLFKKKDAYDFYFTAYFNIKKRKKKENLFEKFLITSKGHCYLKQQNILVEYFILFFTSICNTKIIFLLTRLILRGIIKIYLNYLVGNITITTNVSLNISNQFCMKRISIFASVLCIYIIPRAINCSMKGKN